MSTSVSVVHPAEAEKGRAGSKILTVAVWTASIATAGILAMASFAKLFNFTDTGSRPLADALGVGYGVVAGIGLVELAALVLILFPRTRATGAALTAGAMLGALFSHATIIGFTGNPTAEMWPMAVLVLVASGFVLWAERSRLPGVGKILTR